MIHTDGDRSLKRKWFAEKQLTSIHDLDIPAKTVLWDGFVFKAWQQGDLDGGSVKSPMGAVVLCSSPEGTKIATAENWRGGCTGYSDLHVLFKADGKVITVSETLEEEMITNGFQTLKAKPDPFGAWCWLPDDSITLHPQYSCTPSITPYKGGEAFNITHTDKQFIDFNNSGIPDYPYQLLDSTLTGYCSDNRNLGGRRTTMLANGGNDVWKTCQNLPEGRQTVFTEGFYDVFSFEFVCGSQLFDVKDDITGLTMPTVDHLYLSEIVPADHGMPEELRAMMLDTAISIIRPIGSYSFLSATGEKVFIHSAYFSALAKPIGGEDYTIANYFVEHPTEEKWRMFISVTVGSTVYLHASDQFYTLLQSLAVNLFDVVGIVNWEKAAIMLAYLMPWPNMSGLRQIYYAWKPHDSVMFHGHDNAVYTWTRAAGAVKFDTAGLHTASVSVPVEVIDNVGTRPDISYAGLGMYFCSCNKIKESILSTYYGSPFTGWIKLPDAPEDCTLMQVRPVKVSTELIFLLGVMKYAPVDVPAVYRFAFIKWNNITEGAWRVLMILPFSVGTSDNFAISLYGNENMVKELWSYPSPPAANPQNIVVPYDGYPRWRP